MQKKYFEIKQDDGTLQIDDEYKNLVCTRILKIKDLLTVKYYANYSFSQDVGGGENHFYPAYTNIAMLVKDTLFGNKVEYKIPIFKGILFENDEILFGIDINDKVVEGIQLIHFSKSALGTGENHGVVTPSIYDNTTGVAFPEDMDVGDTCIYMFANKSASKSNYGMQIFNNAGDCIFNASSGYMLNSGSGGTVSSLRPESVHRAVFGALCFGKIENIHQKQLYSLAVTYERFIADEKGGGAAYKGSCLWVTYFVYGVIFGSMQTNGIMALTLFYTPFFKALFGNEGSSMKSMKMIQRRRTKKPIAIKEYTDISEEMSEVPIKRTNLNKEIK